MADSEDLAKAFRKLLAAGQRMNSIDELSKQVERLANARRAENLRSEDALAPDLRYNYGSVARFLGMKRASVRNIDRVQLPRCRDGYVLGVDIMAYRGEITYEEAAAYKEARRRLVTQYLSDPEESSSRAKA